MSYRTATIAAGASLSNEISIGSDEYLAGLLMPAAWTAAGVTFTVAEKAGGTHQPLEDDAGNEIAIVVTASKFVAITNAVDVVAVKAASYLKVRSGTSGTPVNQVAARTIHLSIKKI
jgi:hypothetical protein